jgi:hypothetical protein
MIDGADGPASFYKGRERGLFFVLRRLLTGGVREREVLRHPEPRKR